MASRSLRECDVLGLVGEGRSDRAIAGALATSEHIGKCRVKSLLREFGARTRTETAAMAT